jgi:hypothetical protein
MSTFKLTFGITVRLFGAVAGLSAAIATTALAQEVIDEPGYCAFYYPNANCQNMGPGNPNDINYRRRAAGNVAMAPAGATAIVKRPHKHRSASSAKRAQ